MSHADTAAPWYKHFEFASDGDLDYFKRTLLHDGLDAVRAVDNYGWPATFPAAGHNRLELLDWLLDQGLSVNARSNSGWTALMQAATQGHHEIVARLLDRDADPTAFDYKGETALMAAASRGNDLCVELLLEAMPDAAVVATNVGGDTASLIAAAAGHLQFLLLEDAVKAGLLAAYQRIHARHPDPNAADREGRTALYWAAINRNAPLRDFLLDAGASLEYASLLRTDIDIIWLTMRAAPPTCSRVAGLCA
jgi:ankyrin repeat protein